ncbi:MAG: VanZ family protein, partial [Coriobacteriales bacterium]|nr:VanZ family protein [Coriobacteriales bacterium]
DKPRNARRIVAAILAVVWAAIIFTVSSFPGSTFPSGTPEVLFTIAHGIEYAIFAVLIALALNAPRRALWITALIALVIASLYGVSDEFHQSFTGRNCDVLDWVTDTVGALIGSIGTIWFLSAQKVKKSRARDKKTGL